MTPSARSQPQPCLPTSLWAAQLAAATPLPDARLNTRLERLLTDEFGVRHTTLQVDHVARRAQDVRIESPARR